MATKKTDVKPGLNPRDKKDEDQAKRSDTQTNADTDPDSNERGQLTTGRPHPEPRQNPGKGRK